MKMKSISYKIDIDEELYLRLKEYLKTNKINMADFFRNATIEKIQNLNLPSPVIMLTDEEIKNIDLDELKEKALDKYGSMRQLAKHINVSEPLLSKGFSRKKKFSNFTLSRMVKAVA